MIYGLKHNSEALSPQKHVVISSIQKQSLALSFVFTVPKASALICRIVMTVNLKTC